MTASHVHQPDILVADKPTRRGAELENVRGFAAELQYEVVAPNGPSSLDEVEQVPQVLESRPEITRLVVGVRQRSAIGKAVLGSISQRLILEATVPVLSVRSIDA